MRSYPYGAAEIRFARLRKQMFRGLIEMARKQRIKLYRKHRYRGGKSRVTMRGN